MELVDSNVQRLHEVEIMEGLKLTTLQNTIALAGPYADPNTKNIQVKNTIFSIFRNPKNKKSYGQFMGFMYNMDTVDNLSNNIIELIKFLQTNKAKLGVIFYLDDKYTAAFEKANKVLKRYDSVLAMGRQKNQNRFIAIIEIGKKPIGVEKEVA
tara:strand:- start:154 stop:615 length:462 start_codon:yes stop_codon:yes gene_type:complete